MRDRRAAIPVELLGKPKVQVVSTLQPDGTTGVDTQIYEGAAFVTTNYGASTFFNVGTISGAANTIARGLLQFTYTLPSDAVIQSAILTLQCIAVADAGAQNVAVHRSLVPWFPGVKAAAEPDAEQDASVWNFRNFNGSVAWTGGAGGAENADWTTAATATTSVTAAGAYTWDVTADVIHWKTNTNLGWWIRGNEARGTAVYKQFGQSNNATAGNRPKLVITYKTANPP